MDYQELKIKFIQLLEDSVEMQGEKIIKQRFELLHSPVYVSFYPFTVPEHQLTVTSGTFYGRLGQLIED